MIPNLAAQAATAALVPCTYCGAIAGQPCHNKTTGEPLKHLPAHLPRLKSAEELEPF